MGNTNKINYNGRHVLEKIYEQLIDDVYDVEKLRNNAIELLDVHLALDPNERRINVGPSTPVVDDYPNENETILKSTNAAISEYDTCKRTLICDEYARNAVMIYPGHSGTLSTQVFITNKNYLQYIVSMSDSEVIWELQRNYNWHLSVYQKLFNELKGTYPDLKIGRIFLNIGTVHVHKENFGVMKQIILDSYRRVKTDLEDYDPKLSWSEMERRG